MSPIIEVNNVNEISRSLSFVESSLRFRKRKSKKVSKEKVKSSLDSARFKSIPEFDEIIVEKVEHPLEPSISIFDLIENEKAKAGIES